MIHTVFTEKTAVYDIHAIYPRRGSIMYARSLSLDGATPTAASLLTNFPCNVIRMEERRKTVPGRNFRQKFSVETGQMRVLCIMHERGAVVAHTARNFVIKVGMN